MSGTIETPFRRAGGEDEKGGGAEAREDFCVGAARRFKRAPPPRGRSCLPPPPWRGDHAAGATAQSITLPGRAHRRSEAAGRAATISRVAARPRLSPAA